MNTVGLLSDDLDVLDPIFAMQAFRNPFSRRTFLVGTAGLACAPSLPGRAAAKRDAVSIVHQNRTIVGLPLIWEREIGLLLDRGGRLWQLDPRNIAQPRAAGRYEPHSAEQLKDELALELPRHFRFQVTENFLIAADSEIQFHWASTFEQLHSQFLHYFRLRKIRLRRGRFPMVAIIARSEVEMLRIARCANDQPSEHALGMYSQMTNRIYLYEGADQNAEISTTIRHEVAHQSAFNAGVHPRLADTPLWVAEGIGTLFESSGVGRSTSSDLKTRAGELYPALFLSKFQEPDKVAQALLEIVTGDRMFGEAPEEAYAVAWALTFHLAERRSRQYAEWLRRLAKLKPLADFPAGLRRREFENYFGGEYLRLANEILRLINACVDV